MHCFRKQIFFLSQGSFPQEMVFTQSRKGFSTSKGYDLIRECFHKKCVWIKTFMIYLLHLSCFMHISVYCSCDTYLTEFCIQKQSERRRRIWEDFLNRKNFAAQSQLLNVRKTILRTFFLRSCGAFKWLNE